MRSSKKVMGEGKGREGGKTGTKEEAVILEKPKRLHMKTVITMAIISRTRLDTEYRLPSINPVQQRVREEQDTVVHTCNPDYSEQTCNPSYSGGRDGDHSSKPD
jgi:hypothetical protein